MTSSVIKSQLKSDGLDMYIYMFLIVFIFFHFFNFCHVFQIVQIFQGFHVVAQSGTAAVSRLLSMCGRAGCLIRQCPVEGWKCDRDAPGVRS